MKRLISLFLNKFPYIRNLHEQINKQGAFPPGHCSSPIPNNDELIAYIKYRKPQEMAIIPDIKLNEENQFRLLQEYSQFYNELPFPEKKGQGCRYYFENSMYSYSDAIFLYSFLRKHEPKRIIEVGSGFSSAVMLDTIERYFLHNPEVTFIEPYPDRLKSLLTGNDIDKVTIIDKKLQDVPSEIYSSLESGDLLFIDSSHVVKCGSDLQLLLFDILPFLPSGIFVHFHDVFYPFDYPAEWLKKGVYWNENYFLHAFLSYNCEWGIYFFNNWVAFAFHYFIKDKMPLCVKNVGASLYIRRDATDGL
jgi:hypothetical protein